MSNLTLAAVLALAATAVAVPAAQAKTIVTGGSVSIEVTYPLAENFLWGTAAVGSPPAYVNDAGNPVLSFPIQASRGGDFSRGSQAVGAGFQLYLNGGLYLYPTDADGNELESFDADGNRLCCRNSVGRVSGPNGFSFNTVTGEINAQINGINRDGAEFLLGKPVDGGYELLVTETLAELLTYAYSEYNSEWFPLKSDWPGSTIADLTGQSIGVISYDVETIVAPVPVPAALPLLAGGIGALGVLRLRRKKAA